MQRQPVVTCEHAGNRIPAAQRGLFRGAKAVLASHRGFDEGALALAEAVGQELGVEVLAHSVSRLVIDPNRSLSHPRCFSSFTRELEVAARERIVREIYAPHRARVEAAVRAALKRGPVVHLAAHSFVPVLDGQVRQADFGLLYDPARAMEVAFCRALQRDLGELAPELRVRRNYPYRGKDDGLTTALRRQFPDGAYAGIELELNQRCVRDRASFRRVRAALTAALARHFDRAPG